VVFLTGATGFVGAFLLDELLRRGAREVVCLVRAEGAGAGRERLRRHLARYRLLDGDLDPRITVLAGDLSRPLLGLSSEAFRELARRVHVVYHAGAWVHFAHPYSRLRPANVDGTREVLRLASVERVKPLHHLSTFGVFDSPELGGVVTEDDPLPEPRSLRGGYNQSKWVAEKLVLEGRRRGLPASVYRFGTVAGHRQTGAGDTENLFSQALRSYVELEVAPLWDGVLELLPVDYLVGCIAHLSHRHATDAKTYHLVNPHPLRFADLIAHLGSRGHRVRQVPLDEWRASALKEAGRAALWTALEGGGGEPSRDLVLDGENSRRGLLGAKLGSPHVSRDVLDRYLSFILAPGPRTRASLPAG